MTLHTTFFVLFPFACAGVTGLRQSGNGAARVGGPPGGREVGSHLGQTMGKSDKNGGVRPPFIVEGEVRF